ncbi:MAG TPA: DEAD/DEAH box helicase family protein [Solirubrobacterales bacterium]|nr:DEAD/DEAH box helicase family protein [Solirubrobacterales bacterium]
MTEGTQEKRGGDADLSNPILNSPFEPPERHFVLGERGPTGEVREGRRPSESFIPVPKPSKGSNEQQALDFDPTGERLEQNSLINDVRVEVERWRAHNWNGVTPYTRKLLTHWAPGPHRDDPVFFCQREAAETAIFLAEVAGRHGTADYRRRLEPVNAEHNSGLPRVGLKMATGTGKTVVMAMVIAWQTINKAMTPSDARFAKRFLVVTPGITIRDRLGVLHPERDDSYYHQRDLVPADLWHALLKAEIGIVNYHTFLPRDAKEIKGVSTNTRKLLRGGNGPAADAFRESSVEVSARILRDLADGKGGIVVLNDEAHHCYQDNLTPDDKAEKEDKDRNQEARVWFRGLEGLQKAAPIRVVYDLSATPYYLKGSGYSEGFIFPWVVSDFSLMDAIESGIVKVPRIPVDDDAKDDRIIYLHLWDNIQPPLPHRIKRSELNVANWTIPKTLEGALQSLYRSYAQGYSRYETELAELGEPPPVMIVVCPNTAVSKLVFDWISGWEKESEEDGENALVPGELALLSNVEDGSWAARQRTILIDTVQLESGEPLGKDFKRDAAQEIEMFKQELRQRDPGADVDKLDDAALLREAMNTVGKKGKLGEHIRCVVSVGMLTEGWDANTVTHILGVRPFRSQLLCEQVVGRGLRRRSYAVNEENRLEPEYAEVYGVPFAFIPSDRPVPKPRVPRPAVEVRALPERDELAIEFPKLDGYRIELPDRELHAEFDSDSRMNLDQEGLALWVEHSGLIGEREQVDLEEIRRARPQAVAFALARELIQRQFSAQSGATRPWLFPRLAQIAGEWLDQCVTTDPDVTKGYLLLAQPRAEAAEKIYRAIARYGEERDGPQLVLPIIRAFDQEGSTRDVSFLTRKVVMDPPPLKSHLNHVVLDGPRGNTWEEGLAQHLEKDERVVAYVKNERLGFTIPYVHKGRSHDYIPDFLVRLRPRAEDDEVRTLIVEVSGSQKSPGPTKAKAETARDQWCAAVNNWGEYGRWGYVEVHDPWKEWYLLDAAIDRLYRDDRELLGLLA